MSLTSNLIYKEFEYISLLKGLIDFLFLKAIPKGYLMFPLKIDSKSDSNEEDVGPGPAPSPCKTLFPTGLPSVITAFITPLTFPMYVFLLTKHG